MDVNGVTTKLQNAYNFEAVMSGKFQNSFNAYQRPTIDFSLECEENGQTR